MPDYAEFTVDPADLRRYVEMMGSADYRDVDPTMRDLPDMCFDGGLESEDGGPTPTAGMHGYITEQWAADHDDLNSSMVETMVDSQVALNHYQVALTAIREAYLEVDEDNRHEIDEAWAEGKDDNDNAERTEGEEQSKNAFEYDFAEYEDLTFDVVDPASYFDGLDPVGNGMDIAAPKRWLLNVLGIDIEDFVRHYIGPWSEVQLCASGARRFQTASLNVSDNLGTGLHDLQISWCGAAAEQARLHIGNFTTSVGGAGYGDITSLIDAYNQGVHHISGCAHVSSMEWWIGLQYTGAALKVFPDLAKLEGSDYVKDQLKPKELPDGQVLAEGIRDIVMAASKTASKYTALAAAVLLADALAAIGFGNSAARDANQIYDEEVKPAIKQAKKIVDAVEFPALNWTN
ncbi:MAG: hypothetical protein ACRDXX_08215 [Stackebrandtia sp.]